MEVIALVVVALVVVALAYDCDGLDRNTFDGDDGELRRQHHH